MISVVLYGRNDSHGYNLHKRAAISLNCIAEMLSHEDDEMIFVDYNTPNDLPTFIEAIYDTLTVKAKAKLRTFRVRPELHARLAGPTHLFALEPQARNIGIRRSNPRNRWVLLTNTDMIFVPRSHNHTLSTAVEDLHDGQYVLPRFELPEPLWEAFPRSDPQTVIRTCQELCPRLHLEEIAASHVYMRFDAPGDFQLVPRQTLFEVNGFDERMIHGWHADSNLCKRLFLYYGNRTESLAHRLKGYHCDHTRVATLTHRQDVKLENDLYEFVYLLKDPIVRGQEETWGAWQIDVEEVDFSHGPQAMFVPVLEKLLGGPQRCDYCTDTNDQRNYLPYPARHVLPYIAAILTVYPLSARFVYVGNHPSMLELLARALRDLGFRQPLSYVAKVLKGEVPAEAGATALHNDSEPPLVDNLLEGYDLVLFDFGLDPDSVTLPRNPQRVTDWPRVHRYSIGEVAGLIRSCSERSDERWRNKQHIPEFLILNANNHIFSQFIARFVLAVATPYSSRTRKGRPRVGFEKAYRSAAWKNIEDYMRSFFGYEERKRPVLAAEPGLTIDFTAASSPCGYKDGHWGKMDAWGSWIDGNCADLVFPVSPSVVSDMLVLVKVAGAFEGLGRDPIRISASFEGEYLARWVAFPGYGAVTFKGLLPYRLMKGKQECRLRMEVENPQSVQEVIDATGQFRIGEDPQDLGVRVQSVTFTSVDLLKLPWGQVADFTDKGTGANYMTEFWSDADNLGTWTLGPDCHLVFFLDDQPDEGAIARFTMNDMAVNEEHLYLNVEVSINGKEMAHWELGPNRISDERSLFVPAEVLRLQNPMKISFHIDAPRSPDQLGWSPGDLRPLGFRLTRFRLDKYTTPRLKLGESIDFTSGGNGVEFLRAHWGAADEYGARTVEPKQS